VCAPVKPLVEKLTTVVSFRYDDNDAAQAALPLREDEEDEEEEEVKDKDERRDVGDDAPRVSLSTGAPGGVRLPIDGRL